MGMMDEIVDLDLIIIGRKKKRKGKSLENKGLIT